MKLEERIVEAPKEKVLEITESEFDSITKKVFSKLIEKDEEQILKQTDDDTKIGTLLLLSSLNYKLFMCELHNRLFGEEEK